MRYTKHLSMALIALGLSAPVFAYTNNTVVIPSQHGGFKVGIDALYLRNNAVTNMSDTSYDLGLYSQIGYLFPSTGNDLTVGYTYLRSDNNDAMNIDTIDLEGGQRLVAGALDMRLFGGLRYSHVNYSLNNDVDSISSKFHGMGPRFGADVHYHLSNEFGLASHVSTSLLAGTFSTKYNGEKVNVSESMNGIVPNVGAKLGIDYTYTMSNDSKSLVVFEAGYQTDHNFKVLDNCVDTSFNGPYVDVKYYA